MTTPQKFNISLGVCSGDPFGIFGPSSGIVARIEPGISGGKIHLGMRSAFDLVFLPVASAELTGAILRTWNNPLGEFRENESYLGGELRLGINLILLTAGVYRYIDPAEDNPWLTSFGVGIGL